MSARSIAGTGLACSLIMIVAGVTANMPKKPSVCYIHDRFLHNNPPPTSDVAWWAEERRLFQQEVAFAKDFKPNPGACAQIISHHCPTRDVVADPLLHPKMRRLLGAFFQN
ncbi:MAG TPA: hypothetical protein V6C86_23475 [Oculatellaceae cyanobacterium]